MLRSEISPFVHFGFFTSTSAPLVLPNFDVGPTELIQANRTSS
jgi:hypothetical protein